MLPRWPEPRHAKPSAKLGRLYTASLVANYDRVVIAPLLVPAALDLGVRLDSVTAALTAYLLLFGVMQVVHGSVSDAVGRVRVMRGALIGLGLSNLLAAAAPNVPALVAGRALAGASAAALLPVSVAYIGDRIAVEQRQRTIATLLSAGALGVAAATAVAGVLAQVIGWRAPILVTSLAAPALAVLVHRLPETHVPPVGSLRQRLGRALQERWFRFLAVFALVEGAAMLGFVNFLAPALLARGVDLITVGLVTGTYGLAAVAGGVLLRWSRFTSSTHVAVGGAFLVAGYGMAAATPDLPHVLAANVLCGLAFALVQSTVQTWATEVAPREVRGIATALVAGAVFTGAAVSTASVGGLAAAGAYDSLFLAGALLSAPTMLVGALARARFTST